MRKLILVKHSLPHVVAGTDSADWRLSPEGARRCAPLADTLAPYRPAALYCSVEPKAEETARLVGERLGITAIVVPDLHEHDRRGVPLLGQEAFEQAISRFFACPTDVVCGNESADAALHRFASAVDDILQQQSRGNVVVIAHGTVISLYVAARAGLDAHDLWRRLTCPSVVALTVPALRVDQIIDRIE